MHTLLIPSSYPTKDNQLRGNFYKEQALALFKAGNNIGVIYSETRRITNINLRGFLDNHFQTSCAYEEGIPVMRLHGWNILSMRNSIGKKLWIWETIILYRKYVKRFGTPDIIHVHNGLYGGIAAMKIRKRYGVPYIITEHSSNVLNHRINKSDKGLLRMSYSNASGLISVSKRLKKEMLHYTEKSIEVIPNIINTRKFYPDYHRKADIFTFVSVAFLTENKREDLAISAFNEEFKCHDRVKLVIAGDGEKEEELKKLAAKGIMHQSIEFKGRVTREEIPGFFRKADAFVLPSNFETFGVAYVEALASGIPIITTRCGGPEEFYNENLGRIVDRNNLNQLKEAMGYVYKNKNVYDKKQLWRFVDKNFGEEAIVKKIKDMYIRCKNKKKVCVVTSLHNWDDVRIYQKEVKSLGKKYEIEFHAVGNFYHKSLDGIEIYGLKKSRRRCFRPINWIRLLGRALKSDADAYHLHDPELLLLGLIIKKVKKKVVIYDAHENVRMTVLNREWIKAFLKKPLSRFIDKFEKKISRNLDMVVTVLEEIGEEFTSRNIKTTVIKNYQIEDGEPKENIMGDKRIRIVYAGSISSIRGIEELTGAFKYIERDYITLDIAGDFSSEELKNKILERIKEEPRITYRGIISYKESQKLLKEADIGIVAYKPGPNHDYCLPNKIFEYMSAGVPIIATRIPYWEEKFKKFGNIFFIDEVTDKNIAEGILYLVNNKEDAINMGRSGYTAYRHYFTWQGEEKKLFSMYENLIDKHQCKNSL